MRYIIGQERRDGRCVWCWESLGVTDPHVTVRPGTGLGFGGPLRFHSRCWPAYMTAVPARLGAETGAWTPRRIEELRLRVGLGVVELAKRLKISHHALLTVMEGGEVTPLLAQKLRWLESRERRGSRDRIDWSKPEAVFCLRMHARKTAAEVARLLGVNVGTVHAWERRGVSRFASTAWPRLDALAEKEGFDRGMVVPDRAWRAEYLAAAVTESGKTVPEWARACEATHNLMLDWMSGKTAITRVTCWRLTRAAVRFGVKPPQPGMVNSARRKPRAESQWSEEEIALLGTMSDEQVAAAVGRSVSAVTTKRTKLGISPVTPASPPA